MVVGTGAAEVGGALIGTTLRQCQHITYTRGNGNERALCFSWKRPGDRRRTGRLARDGRVDGGASRDTDVASGGSLRGEELVGVAVTVRGAGGASQGSHGGGCESSLHGGDKIIG